MKVDQAHVHVLARKSLENMERRNYVNESMGLDDKRPFGNSDVGLDILELLDIAPRLPDDDDNGYRGYTEEQRAYALAVFDAVPNYLRSLVKEML